MYLNLKYVFYRDNITSVRSLRPGTTSSMATFNQTTSDDDSTLHQISSSANVSFSHSDAFTLPGVALRASANCNINDQLCNSMLGGDIMSGMGNIVVSVSSSGQTIGGTSSHNASANVNYEGGRNLDISASSSASNGRTTHNKRTKEVPSMVNHGCTSGPASHNKHTKNAQSSVNLALNPNRIGQGVGNSKKGCISGSANAVVDSTQDEPSCSSNAEVILRPENVRSRQRSLAWQRTVNSKLVKNIIRVSLGHLTRTYYVPLLQKRVAKVRTSWYKPRIFHNKHIVCKQCRESAVTLVNKSFMFISNFQFSCRLWFS